MLFQVFLSTRPRGARLRAPCYSRYVEMRFYPRARGGRDPMLLHDFRRPKTWFLSTRPRGARHRLTCFCDSPIPFLSTRPRGARQWADMMVTIWREFLSTRPRGARPFAVHTVNIFCLVSIHAPAGGATILPTPHLTRLGFLSTRPRGARPSQPPPSPARVGFYPRARGGRDSASLYLLLFDWLFLSTRPRGARQLYPKRLEITKL